MFLPTTRQEIQKLGWETLDVILVTGDSYIDSPFMGVSLIGKVLLNAGYRVGIIAQPDIHSSWEITRLGEPKLFWGVSGGSVDSMVANYTSTKRKRRKDDFTPGGINNLRPDRASIVYTNLIKQYSKNKKPIVLGGIEASLRRIAHYDFWSNKVRRSILFDAKADLIIYGMAEKTILELAARIKNGKDYTDLKGICYISKEKKTGYTDLPPFSKVRKDNHAFIDMFNIFYENNDPLTSEGLLQKQDTRYLVQNPIGSYLTQEELDKVYGLDFERDLHPYYKSMGKVKALDTIKFSLSTHRGCYGECNFCAIAVHQGQTVRWRSKKSILKEAELLSLHPDFKGYIHDAGGPTANMYGFECTRRKTEGSCKTKRCLYPKVCSKLGVDHSRQIKLLRSIRKLKGIKGVFIASGIRYDLLLADKKNGIQYLKEVVNYHTSGQMKVAPEHCENHVLEKMGKPNIDDLLKFRDIFYGLTRVSGKKQFLTYYLIAAHPACTESDMKKLKAFATKYLKIFPEQVQVFTPTPSTYSSLMYFTKKDPFTGESIFVEENTANKKKQKDIVVSKRY